MLELGIRLEGTGGDTGELLDWLHASRRRGNYTVREHSTDHGQLGSLDTIIAAFSAVVGVASLVVAIAAWLDTRPKRTRPRVTFEVGEHRVTVENPDEETVTWLFARLTADGDDPRP